VAEVTDILVAGDWVVDEYWYLVRQHSEISSHTGFVHYRASKKPTERVLDLCSAGHVARVLFSLRPLEAKSYTIWGIGDWNAGDTEHLEHLIHAGAAPECQASLANYSLGRRFCDHRPEGIRLFPLHQDAQTTRVVRLYRSSGSGIEQLNRVDWESPLDSSTKRSAALPDGLPSTDIVKSVVIHDLCKGGITAELIEALNERYPSAMWYVRTKSTKPEWLKVIKKKIALFLVGPEVAEPGNPWGSWLSGKKISYQSFSYLRKIDGKATIVLSDQREVIGRVNDGQECLTAKAPMPNDSSLQVGWPSALLAALVHISHNTANRLEQHSMEQALLWAQEHAGMPVDDSSADDSLRSENPVVVIEPWDTQESEWTSAMRDMGIIPAGDGGLSFLEVWRGASDLPGYVACIQGKRDAVIDIGKRLRAFTRSADPARSLSILLQADPGSGKTHLAKLLAQKFDLSLQSFDITTMLHRDDLLDLFDAIATEQANNPNRRVLVFVDEINSSLDGAGVYGAFLAPLEQGVYVRRGRVFSLRPCVWIFAGTNSESKTEKVSDFEQRLTATVKLDFKSLSESARTDTARQDVRQKARLEQVYLGATMIQQRYRDVEKVGESLLRTFFDLPSEESPARKIRKSVEELRNVQRGVVTLQNLNPDADPDLRLIKLVGKA